MSAKILASMSCLIVAASCEAFFPGGYSFATSFGGYQPYYQRQALPYAYAAAAYRPLVAAAAPPQQAPVAAVAEPAQPVQPVQPAPLTATQGQVHATQYHAQDEVGNVAYGYANPTSAKEESRDAHGRVTGAYSYVDASGRTNHVRYVADEAGFRVTGANNLPIGPSETPEVAAARESHFQQLRRVGSLPF